MRLQRTNRNRQYRQVKKNYHETEKYIHLTQDDRKQLALVLAKCISSWEFARLFAECIDKVHFDSAIAGKTIPEQSFEQVVSRFEFFLKNACTESQQQQYGILIHDNSVTVAKKHTDLMKKYHKSGTLWTHIDNIIETCVFSASCSLRYLWLPTEKEVLPNLSLKLTAISLARTAAVTARK